MILLCNGAKVGIKEVKRHVQETLERLIYSATRYENNATMSTLFFKKCDSTPECLMQEIKQKIRKTDEVLKINDQLYIVIFNYVEHKNAYKGLQVLTHHMDRPNRVIHSSIIEVEKNETIHALIQKSLTVLCSIDDDEGTIIVDQTHL